MKHCPRCLQNYSDETIFCLSDGTPLLAASEAPEEMTVIRAARFIPLPVQPNTPALREGVSPLFAHLSIGLLIVLLAGGGILLLIFALNRISVPGNQNSNINTNSNSTFSNDGPNKLNEQMANLKAKQAESESEKRRIEDAHKKSDELKTIPTPQPTVTPPPRSTPPPPQPTARIKFNRGAVSTTVSGKVNTERSFLLEARNGQYLSARLNSGGGCVVFGNGSARISYVTNSGDNRLTLANNCSSSANFSLTVFIK